ncbi:secretin, partial [Burkholderia sp. Tr-849]|nr:secretin [Burkholderia sp. Tr-849]
QPPVPAEPQKTPAPAPVAAAVPQHEPANAARIARIEAAAARLAAAGSDTPAQPAGQPKRRTPAAAHAQQVVRVSAAPESTDR